MKDQINTIREALEKMAETRWPATLQKALTALTQLEAMVGEQEPVAEVMPRRIGPGHGTPEKFTYDVNWFTVDPHKWSGKLFAAPPAQQQPTDDAILKERDEAEDFIDALLDEVLGADRPEWSSAYGRAEALAEVQERMTALHKPMVDKAWQRFEQAQAEAVPSDVVRDAARYRFIRDNCNRRINIEIDNAGVEISDTVDAAIDAAIAQQKGASHE